MSTVSTVEARDITQRRWARAAFAVCLVLFAASVVLDLVTDQSGATSWGTDSPFVKVCFMLAVFCFPVVGALITHRHPRSTIGWLMLGVGLLWAWSGFSDAYILRAVVSDPGSLPNPALVGATEDWLWVPAIGLMGTFLILLFPDGHLPSPRWRVVAWASAATIALGSMSVLFRPGPLQDVAVKGLDNPFGLGPLAGFLDLLSVSLILLPLCILASAAGLVFRFRRSRGVERLQLKWLAAASAFVALVYLLAIIGTFGFGLANDLTIFEAKGDDPPGWVLMAQNAALVSFGVIPLAVGVAILKHRLYGIDVVINKAVVFGALGSFITAVYVAIVVGVGSLVARGGEPNLALSIAATAVVAVAFQPVRNRAQRLANRLVYGARATPYEVLADLAERMGGAYDAAELLPLMARTIAEGIGARQVDVWLCLGPGLVREASWLVGTPTASPTQPTSVGELADLEGDRVVPVRHQGELLGALTVVKPATEPITPAEDNLVNDVAAQAGLVLRNVRLIEELRASRQRLVSTQDEERRRLERNLHDGAQQSLVSVSLMLRTARSRWGAGDDPIGAGIDRAADQLALAIDELRELARGIHPAILTDRGLGPALRSLAERSPVPVVLDYELTERPERDIEGSLYFVVTEALTNVAKYAAASQVEVRVVRADDALVLTVSDDGAGGADPGSGSGLRGLADRVAVVDGTLDITSPAGRGTTLTCRIPVPAGTTARAVSSGEGRTTTPLGVGQ